MFARAAPVIIASTGPAGTWQVAASFFEIWNLPSTAAEIAVPADATFRAVFLFHGSAFLSGAPEQYRPEEASWESSRPAMIVPSASLIRGDADVPVTVRIGATRVTDVVDAALVVCTGGHLVSLHFFATGSSRLLRFGACGSQRGHCRNCATPL